MKNKEINQLEVLFNLIIEVKNFVRNKLIENNTINETGFSILLKNNFFEIEKLKISLPDDIYQKAISYYQSIANYYNNSFSPKIIAFRDAQKKSHENIEKYQINAENAYSNFIKFTKQETLKIVTSIKEYLQNQDYYLNNFETIEEIFKIFTNIKKFFNIDFTENNSIDIVGLEEILKQSFSKIERLEIKLSEGTYNDSIKIIEDITNYFNNNIGSKILDYQKAQKENKNTEEIKQDIIVLTNNFITETNKLIIKFSNNLNELSLNKYEISFSNTTKFYNINKQKFETSLATKNIEDFCNILKSYYASIPYLIHKENLKEGFFHSIFHIIMEIFNFNIRSEDSTNQGRIDSVVKLNEEIFIFEFKLIGNNNGIEQIVDKQYYQKFTHENLPIYAISVNFNPKIRNIDDCKIERIKY